MQDISNFLLGKYIELPAKHGNISTKKRGIFILNENKNALRDEAINFGVSIALEFESIKGISVYTNQLLRASSSIGANMHEAKYAESRDDFIHKLEISLKECYETEYWLEFIFKIGKLSENKYKELKNECGTIRRKLIASITTAKANANK